MIFIKKFLKRVFVFFLVFVMIFNISFQKNQKEVKAVAVVDDALIALVITGVSIAVGTYAKTSDSSPTELFKDMFGSDTYDNLSKYMRAVEFAPAMGFLDAINDSSIRSVASSVKKRYKHPVQVSGSKYLYVDSSGNVVESDTRPYEIGQYYLVDDINDYVDAGSKVQDASGSLKLTKADTDLLIKAVGTVTRPLITLGKNIFAGIIDSVKAVRSNGVLADNGYLAVTNNSSVMDYYKDKTCIYLGDFFPAGYLYCCAAFNGILLELHDLNDNVYYGIFTLDQFQEKNSFYSSSGELSIFTRSMSLNFLDISRLSGINFSGPDNNFFDVITYSGFYSVSSFATQWNNKVTHFYIKYNGATNLCIESDWFGNKYSVLAENNSPARIINSGETGNYLIGQVNEDGSISYSTFGDESESNYIDGLDTSTVTTKVSGDVKVDSDTLDSVSVGTATVDGVNETVAELNTTVKAIDSTVSNGFNGILGILSAIKDLIMSIPEKIAAAFASFFSMLWGFLSDILDAVHAISSPIVSAVNGVVTPIVNAIKAIPDSIADISVFQTIIDGLSEIASGISGIVVSIPQTLIDIVESIKDGVLAVPVAIDNVVDHILDLPEYIADQISSSLVFLFVPNNNFFNDWKDKINALLVAKLPYDTYVQFIQDIKDIVSYRLEDITINIYGKQCTVVTFTWYYDNIETINHWVRGVMFFILIFFNINQIYKMIRGTSLYKVTSYADKMGG